MSLLASGFRFPTIPPNTPVIPGDCARSPAAARANSGVSGLWPHPVRRVDFCRPCYGLSATTFIVEHTNHGWPVGAGIERMGLFPTQRLELDEVKRTRGARGKLAHGRPSRRSSLGLRIGHSVPREAPQDRHASLT